MNTRRSSRSPRGAVGTSLPLGVALVVLVLLLCSCRSSVATGQAESLDIEEIAQRDLYAVLELHPGAAAFDVKAAYRKLAKKWHPDKNRDETAQNKFAEIAEAYEVLSDESSRQLYDHARRVRAAHDRANSGSDGNRHHSGRGWGAGDWETGSEWAYADGADWDEFGSSFGGGGGGGAGGGTGFGAAFGGGPFAGGGGGGGGAFEFRARDPMELFEALFGGSSFDDPDSDHDYTQDPYDFQEQRQQQQQQQFEGMPWVGQDFEQYQDYEDGGQMYRRVITTVIYGDGSSQSTAQDFLFDESRDAWFEKTGPFEYHGPGVAPHGRGDTPVDNVLRMNEFLRVGHSITSVDKKFTAVLESDCNLVVYHNKRGRRKEEVKVWETSSFDSEGRCFVAIQSNGMLVVMAGTDPTAPGNVLWSNNQGHVGWIKQNTFHAAVLPTGNLVVSQGDSPMHPAARNCLWGVFGCPGDGGVMEWKLVWVSFRSKAGDIWCKVVGCDGGQDYFCSGGGCGGGKPSDSDGNDTGDFSSWNWRSGDGGSAFDPWGDHGGRQDSDAGGIRISDLLMQPTAALKKAAGHGVAWLTEALAKLKAAAEDTAYAASRPRHW